MLMINTPIRNPDLPNPGQRRLYVDIRLASLMKNLFCNDTKGMMNNGTSASRNGNQDEQILQCSTAEHPDNPREELEFTGIGTGIIGTKT